jgi:hypothetical protein
MSGRKTFERYLQAIAYHATPYATPVKDTSGRTTYGTLVRPSPIALLLRWSSHPVPT